MLTHIAYPSEVISQRQSSWMKDLSLIAIGSILLALCAPLSIKLPFTPVPIALAPQLCLALGAILGRNRGSLAVLGFLLQGAMGLPVFALGTSGLLHFVGPTGGYLFGYVAAAYVTGYLIEKRGERSNSKTFLALAAGNAIIYLFGIAHLSLFIGFKSAVLLGMLPFLLGDALKLLLTYKGIKRLVQRSNV
jgi:biotin transport system substrate-specific component